jgi:5-methylcytosine-specific restriction endonuclease McrA
MIVTKEWLVKYRSPNGSYFAAQIKALGFNYPPQKGWLKDAIGLDITENQQKIFEAGSVGRKESRAVAYRTNREIAAQLTKRVKKKKSVSFVSSNDFLSSYDWRKLRMEALKKYGSKCQCCGATPATGAVINVDHIKPRKFFPELALSLSNLQVLCHECNHGKGNWDQTDWRNPDR